MNIQNTVLEEVIDLDKVRETAEGYYQRGDFFCSESLIKTIKDQFNLDITDDIVAMASGFPVGIGGSGCTCGAVSGGIMALGLFFGRTEGKDEKVKNTMSLAKELHNFFIEKNKTTCCRVLTRGMDFGKKEHKNQCVGFTGLVAEETARIICRELNIKTKRNQPVLTEKV